MCQSFPKNSQHDKLNSHSEHRNILQSVRISWDSDMALLREQLPSRYESAASQLTGPVQRNISKPADVPQRWGIPRIRDTAGVRNIQEAGATSRSGLIGVHAGRVGEVRQGPVERAGLDGGGRIAQRV